VTGHSITEWRWIVIFEKKNASFDLADAYNKKTAQCHKRGGGRTEPVIWVLGFMRCRPHVNTSEVNSYTSPIKPMHTLYSSQIIAALKRSIKHGLYASDRSVTISPDRFLGMQRVKTIT
jgi:hypothetical protein